MFAKLLLGSWQNHFVVAIGIGDWNRILAIDIVFVWVWYGSVQAEEAARGLAGRSRWKHDSHGGSQGMGSA